MEMEHSYDTNRLQKARVISLSNQDALIARRREQEQRESEPKKKKKHRDDR